MQARQVITCGGWKSEARGARITTTSRVGGVRGSGETCVKKHMTSLDTHTQKQTPYDGTRFNVVSRTFRGMVKFRRDQFAYLNASVPRHQQQSIFLLSGRHCY